MKVGLSQRFRSVFSIDLRTLAFFRVGLALVILADLIIRGGDIQAFYTDAGVLPRGKWIDAVNAWHWSIHAMNGQLAWQIALFVLAGLFALALLVGYRTRLSTCVSYVLLASLINRNPLILQGGDELMVTLCFWSMFLPLGARWSVDAAMDARFREEPNALRSLESIFSVATLAILLQVLYPYFFTVFLKTGRIWRSSFDAAFYALSLQQFATPLGHWLTGAPKLLKIGTVLSLVVESVAPYLVLSPIKSKWTRSVGLLLLVGLHASFLATMHLGLFPWVDFVGLSLFLPAAWWLLLEKKSTRQKRGQLTLYYDEPCGFCLRMALLLREFFCPVGTKIFTGQSDPKVAATMEREYSWVVVDGAGRQTIRFEAVRVVMGQSLFFRPLAWVLSFGPFDRAGDWLYRWVAQKRETLGPALAWWTPYRSNNQKLPRVFSGVAIFFLCMSLVYNATGVPMFKLSRPRIADVSIRIARLDQRWDMFSPNPMGVSIVPQIVGHLRGGADVNLYENTPVDPDWEPPDLLYSFYGGYRWRKFLERVYTKNHKTQFGLGAQLCRQWNRRQDIKRGDQLASVEIFFIELFTNTEKLSKVRKRSRAWRHWCFKEFEVET